MSVTLCLGYHTKCIVLVLQGRYTAPRSPQENDTAGLLKEVEPVDYTNYTVNNSDPFLEEGETSSHYQARAKPNRPTSLGTGSKAKGPPKGIFDDI